MGHDNKYGDVITEFGDIPADEPVFILRGRDMTSLDTLRSYHTLCSGINTPPEHLELILATFKKFEKWQQENPDKLKRPDSKTYFERKAVDN